jgi:small conductance mechanosensitive channel
VAVIRSALTQEQINEVCDEGTDLVCRAGGQFLTSTEQLSVFKWVVDRPLALLTVVVLAFLISRIGRWLIGRWGRRLASNGLNTFRRVDPLQRIGTPQDEPNGRLGQRAETLVRVASSSFTVAVWSVAFVVALGLFNINLAPLVAGAGVVGIALGFGAQSVVSDFLAGFFMLFEDQYGVGDIVDLGDASGVVENFSLRTTTLRDVNGTVWHIPNHEIRRVGNKSQVWSRAVLDIEVSYDTDLRQAQKIILDVAEGLWQDQDYEDGDIIDQPEVWGIERLGADGIAIRLVVKTDPAEQWAVARELRLRIKEAFDDANIEIPFPQRTLWIKQAEREPAAPFQGPDAGTFEPSGSEWETGDEQPESPDQDADDATPLET